MTHVQFLSVKKLNSKAIIEVAARHNLREILAELGTAQDGHIDSAKVGLNRVLIGHHTAAAVARHAKMLMDDAGVKALRKDAVRALEIIFGLPPHSPIDQDRFFDEATEWAGRYFCAPIISAIVHNDEAAPHCHVLVLPLIDGRMVGSDLMGGRAKLQAMQADFHTHIGERHGLTRQAAHMRHSATTRQEAMQRAFHMLQANSGLSDAVLLMLLKPHGSDPAPLLEALGLSMPTPAIVKGEFAKMMTKPCKPEKPIGFGRHKPIGFDGSAASANEQTLSCVGFANSVPSFPPPAELQTSTSMTLPQPSTKTGCAFTAPASAANTEQPQVNQPAANNRNDTAEPSDRLTRERDIDRCADEWNPDTGEFVPIKPPSRTTHKSIAAASVRVALESIGKASRLPQRPPGSR